MTAAERFLALRRMEPFGRLDDGELLQLALAARERSFGPGATVARAGAPMRLLHAVVEGEVVDEADRPQPGLFDVPSLLLGEPVPSALRAGAGGARCLVLSRSHFFTLVHESPALVMEVLRMLEGAAP